MTQNIKKIIISFKFIITIIFIILSKNDLIISKSYIAQNRSPVDIAEMALKQAFLSLREAENADGDVSYLISNLNMALENFHRANRLLKSGEYNEAFLISSSIIDVANQIIDNAVEVKLEAENRLKNAFRNQVITSLLSICLIIFFGFEGWKRFKKYYLIRQARGLGQ